jgi:hypothetical protein
MESAFQKARTIGKKEEEIFINNESKLVNWQFIDVADVYEIESLKDGEQVYSTTHENTERQCVHQLYSPKGDGNSSKKLNFCIE